MERNKMVLIDQCFILFVVIIWKSKTYNSIIYETDMYETVSDGYQHKITIYLKLIKD